jgi:hypothetical protein
MSWSGLDGKAGKKHLRGVNLFYLDGRQQSPKLLPFGDALGDDATVGFPLGAFPGAREQTRVYFLPDLNNDGQEELLIGARAAYLIACPSASKNGLSLVRKFHYGMDE